MRSMDRLELKICGMKLNIHEVADIKPDYLGFIFYPGSPRNFKTEIPDISSSIKKVGVFVNDALDVILDTAETYDLDIIQLHGNEPAVFCEKLNKLGYPVWKVFSVGNSFDFGILKEYEDYVTHFLFDTKGLSPGGNGIQFDWSILRKYDSEKPLVLSGGINPKSIDAVKELYDSGIPLAVIDVNSGFETKPGLKDIKTLKEFKDELQRG